MRQLKKKNPEETREIINKDYFLGGANNPYRNINFTHDDLK